jgi:hypothetical protein
VYVEATIAWNGEGEERDYIKMGWVRGDAFFPLALLMTVGEVNSCLLSPKMGMREDLPALLEIALARIAEWQPAADWSVVLWSWCHSNSHQTSLLLWSCFGMEGAQVTQGTIWSSVGLHLLARIALHIKLIIQMSPLLIAGELVKDQKITVLLTLKLLIKLMACQALTPKILTPKASFTAI